MSASIDQHVRAQLWGQRDAIVAKIEECALAVLSTADENGAPVIAEALRQAGEIARWAIYDPEPYNEARP